jgi:glutathione synthase/RimK-type ligase-like ATP-grasp enzyme
MNKLCIIAKNKKTYFINRLIEEVGNGVVVFDPWSDIEFHQAENYIVRTTGVYHSNLDLMMIKGLPSQQVYNSHESLQRFRSKHNQYSWFELVDVPILPWISLNSNDLVTLEKFSVLYPEMVVKPHVGQGGWGIEVLKREDLRRWFKKEDKNYLLQPFIKGAAEFRYFFLKDSAPIVLKRNASTGIAANFQKEGSAEVSELPVEFVPEIERLISLSGAHYGAIDLLIDHGRMYVLELNTVPGIEQLEKVSQTNVMKAFLSSLAK